MIQPRQTVKSIFDAALEIESPAEREAYLAQIGAEDPQLRQQVEALLAAYLDAASFLETPPSSAATLVVPPLAEPVGASIGPYKLREVLGEGGMGTVYVAEQEKPLRRKVALKVIKPGMDTREVIGRFEAERQALALMDHANIAKVHDAGATETGRPYFVMELVRGMPITEYCDRRKLPPRERIKLCITVCQAIQHAHQRGIIHRDLKPSNVLITLHDGTPVPKVIDFGVAKAVNQKLTEHTLYTRHAQLVGTPLYMSPEQAELSGLEIDPRSDVYSLGVLLYELLTGHTPFDKETFSNIGYDEMRRMIREDEPPRPSHRVSTLAAEARSTVSTHRATDERQLARVLRGELDWIVMKALEKDRTRRYGGADALAADLQRYLDDEPIQACPPSLAYRARKFIHRKRSALTTAAVLAVCIPLALYNVFNLIRGTGPDSQRNAMPAAAQESASKLRPSARAPGRELLGLVPEPLLIPEVGRWQLITKKPRGVIRSATWSPDEKQFALAEANHVRIYDTTNLQLLHVLVAHSQPVTSVAWHPDGSRLASASEDGTVRLWTSDGVPTHLLEGHSGPVYRVAWRPDGEQLASAAADGTVRMWAADGSPLRTLDEAGRHVFGIDWSPDGKQLASVGGDIRPASSDGNPGDNSLRIWDADSGTLVRKTDSPVKYSALCVDWRPDGNQLAVGYGDVYRSPQIISGGLTQIRGAGVRLWSIDGKLHHDLLSEPGSGSTAEFGTINAVAWDPLGKRLAFGGRHGVVRIWNADDQSVTDTQAGNLRDVGSISWKRDGTGLLATSRESVREWNATDGGATLLVEGLSDGTHYFLVAKWSPDGKSVAGRISGGSNLFWNADGKPAKEPDRPDKNIPGWWEVASETRRPDGTPGAKLEGPFPAMREWAWSKKGWLAGATWSDASVRIWNDQGKLITTLKGHRGGVESVDWSPDGETLASGGGDSVRLWKADGTPGPVMTGHTDEVYPVAWSPDGQWISSGGTDSAIRLWKPDGTPGKVIRGHQGGIHAIAWNPDSKRIVSASWLDNTLRVWNVETGKTEWQALKLDTDAAITLSASGQPLHGERDLLESGLLYLVEKPNGATDLLTFGDFRKRFSKSFVNTYVERSNKAVVKEDWEKAEAAFADVTTFLSDGDPALRNQIARIGVYIYYSRGNAHFRMEQFDNAIAQYTKAIELDANDSVANSSVFNNRGWTWYQLKQHDKALADYTKAIELNPKNRMPYANRGSLQEELEQRDEAVADFTKGIELNPTAWWFYNRARVWGQLQQHDKALADLTKACEVEPNNAKICDSLSWLLSTCPDARLHDYTRAVELARKATSIDPDSVDFWGTLGTAEYRTGDWAAALQASGKAVDIDTGKNRFGHGWAVNSIFLAMEHWQLGHKDEAAFLYDNVVEWMEQNKSENEDLKRFHAEATALLGIPEGSGRRAPSPAQPAGSTEVRPAAVPLPEE